MKRSGSVCLCALLLASVFFIMPASASYPMFHYDVARTGNVTGDAPITNQLLWNSNITGGCVGASPIISNGKVFISNWGAAYHGGVDALYCLNETTGEILWTNTLGGSGAASTAAISCDKLFVGTVTGDLYGINASNGTTLWSTTIEHNPSWYGVASSPVVYDNKIYVTTYSTGNTNASLNNGTLHVLDFNGNYLWNVSAGDNYHYTSPAIADGKVFFAGNLTNNHSLFCVNISTPHNILWRFNTTNNKQVRSTPAIWNDTVFFASIDRLYAVNASTGTELWNNSFSSKMSSPALAYGNVFIGSDPTGNLSCFNASTGDNVWNFTANGKIDSSPLIANNTVYFGTNIASGTVYALNVTDGSLRWSYTLSPPSGSWYSIMSSPAVSNGTVFIGADCEGILAFSPSGANITSFTMESASSAKGQSFTARVNITTSSDAVSGWYVVAVSGVNSNGNSLAGIGTVYLNSSDAVNRMPVLIHVPSLAESGVYNLYAVIYRLNDYPSVLLDREGSVSVTVS